MRKRITVASFLIFGCVVLDLAAANFFPDQTWRAIAIMQPLYDGIASRITPLTAGARRQADLDEKSEKIQALLRAGKFDEAEPLARECIRQLPEGIHFLGQLEMVLNGEGRFREADELRDKIRKLWEKDHQARIADGSSVREYSWARVVGSSKEYDVFGVEYFVPLVIEGPDLRAYYKVIAFSKGVDGASRLLFLNKSASEKNYFLEEFSDTGIFMAKTYSNEIPDIRAVVADAIAYLDISKDKQAELPHARMAPTDDAKSQKLF